MRRRRQELVTRLQCALEIGETSSCAALSARNKSARDASGGGPPARVRRTASRGSRRRPRRCRRSSRAVPARGRRRTSATSDRRCIGAQPLRELDAAEAGHVGRWRSPGRTASRERVSRATSAVLRRSSPSIAVRAVVQGARAIPDRLRRREYAPRTSVRSTRRLTLIRGAQTATSDGVSADAFCVPTGGRRRCAASPRRQFGPGGVERAAVLVTLVLTWLAVAAALWSGDVAADTRRRPGRRSSARDPTTESPDVPPYLYTALETALVIAGGPSGTCATGRDERWGRAIEWRSWKRKLFTTEDIDFDGDHFNTNAVGHPLDGTVYYQIARGNGLGPGARSCRRSSRRRSGSTSSSFPNIRRINDLIMTPVGGAIIGEATYRLGRYLAKSGIGRRALHRRARCSRRSRRSTTSRFCHVRPRTLPSARLGWRWVQPGPLQRTRRPGTSSR